MGPGGRLGIVGGGQLGRMLAMAAQTMGCRVAVYEPSLDPPAASVAHEWVRGEYEDVERLAAFVAAQDVTTFEFENLDARALAGAAERGVVRPGPEVLAICQDRAREKTFFATNHFPCAHFATIANRAEVDKAIANIGYPCVVKTTRFGYDGKGQFLVRDASMVAEVWERLGAGAPLIVEEWIRFERELSVLVARTARGEVAVYPVVENRHRNHILDVTLAPAQLRREVEREVCELAHALAVAIDLHGLLAIELFDCGERGILINELAPRPHNSGHYTMDAAVTSQFAQQVRAVFDLPLGSVELVAPAVMVNLLGELWHHGEPDWHPLLRTPGAHLHLYGKAEARTGRKMGHFTVRNGDAKTALRLALDLQEKLRRGEKIP